ALDHKSVIVSEGSHRVVVFKKAPPRTYSKPFTRFSLPYDVDSQGVWDAELDMADSSNYIMEERFDQLEKVKEALDSKYKELEESKPILEVLENYMTYRKKLDEVLMGRARLSRDNYGEEAKMRIVEHGLPKKMCDPGKFVLPVKVNETVEMSALADTGASVSVLPYCLFKNLGIGDPKPYNSNLTMADNTQAKAMGEVKNVRIQIMYQAYLVDFLILDIPVEKELPLLLGHLFLRTRRAVIDMRRGTLCIDDGVIHHTYFPKPKAKSYLDNFA
nr:hypothetical protein [Tanacetum cinerariifolium]